MPLASALARDVGIGDLVEDRLLVYLWLKPVPRWQLPAAAVLATVTVVVPLAAVPARRDRRRRRPTELLGALALASVLAVVAYSGLFVAAGIWFRRAVWWGLAFVLLWENVVAHAVEGAARLSIASYAQSLVADAAGIQIAYADRQASASVVVPLAAGLAGLVLAVIRYRRAEID